MWLHGNDFFDDFDGPAGAPPGPAWTAELGGGGWGDEQLQTYTQENAALDGHGCLAITARRDLTSARLITKGRVTARHGRVEARIRVPAGPGVWPAFWMLGADIDAVGWPACGEIDVMEVVGSEPRTVHATVHCPGHAGVGHGLGAAHTVARDLAEDFHVYAVDWTPDQITWRLDDVAYRTLARADVPAWAFDGDMFLLLNLAIGGGWPGNELDPNSLPATMLVDWVRVSSR
jgi:beta-glucanase (GH16 family)